MSAEENSAFGLPVSWRHPVRKLLVTALWPHLRHQIEFNQVVAGQADRSVHELGALRERVEDALAGHHSALVRHDEVLARFDRERSEFEEGVNDRIEYLQRQAFARYHDATGAMRRDLTELSQKFTEVTSILSSDLSGLSREFEVRLKSIDAQLHGGMDALQSEQSAQLLSVREQVAAAGDRLDTAIGDQRVRLASMELLFASLQRSLPELPEPQNIAAIPDATSLFMDALEKALAPPAAVLRERWSPLLEVVQPASRFGPVLELSPRTGVWLRMLHEEQLPGYGVGTQSSLREDLNSTGIDVRVGDLVSHLRGLAPGSVGAICAFGLFDRLAPDEMIETLDLSMRALHENGVLVIEGLEPASIVVDAPTVYIESGNRLPVPPGVLACFVRARGFIDLVTVNAAGVSDEPGTHRSNVGDLGSSTAALHSGGGSLHYVITAHRP